ncbi:MAG: hypothetical protein COA53_02190 [Rhodobacteraceae bacterium]|nr:MAG: hypothetical protein COA53_02190 [Paracoccaceae bacterium]
MKLLALTSVLTAAASTAFAGSVAYVSSVSPETMAAEATSMGGSGAWLIPLILVALVLLVGQNDSQPIKKIVK